MLRVLMITTPLAARRRLTVPRRVQVAPSTSDYLQLPGRQVLCVSAHPAHLPFNLLFGCIPNHQRTTRWALRCEQSHLLGYDNVGSWPP
jgi:hypothetical protein